MIRDGNVYCGAEFDLTQRKPIGFDIEGVKFGGWKDVKTDMFICRECLMKLPDDLRRRVMTTTGEQARAARSEALALLGAPIEEDRLNLPRPRLDRERYCECEEGPKVVLQKNMFGARIGSGDVDEVCDRCGATVKKPESRRFLA